MKEESTFEKWQEEALENQQLVAVSGLNDIELSKDGKAIDKVEYGLEILNEIKAINNELNLNYEDVINRMIDKFNDSKLTYAYKVRVNKRKWICWYILNLAKKYKKEAYNNRFKLEGYEDLELSTQILMKESIKKRYYCKFSR